MEVIVKQANIGKIGFFSSALFLMLTAVLHLIEPEYDTSKHLISDYELGKFGWMMSLAKPEGRF